MLNHECLSEYEYEYETCRYHVCIPINKYYYYYYIIV